MIEILSYEENTKFRGGSLIGFFTVRIVEWDLTIRMCEFVKGDRHWVAMPSYSVRDPTDPNKWKFCPRVKFGSPRQEKFLEACKKSLKEYKNKPINQGNNEA